MDNKRRPNFSDKEIKVLIDSTKDHYKHLVAKHRDANTNAKKKRAYSMIARAVSAVGVANRTEIECRKKYASLQSNVKAKAGNIARERNLTGGGPPPTALTEREEQVMETLAPITYEGVSGGVDTSDAISDATDGDGSFVLQLESSPWKPSLCSETKRPRSSMMSEDYKLAIELQRENNTLLKDIKDLLIIIVNKL